MNSSISPLTSKNQTMYKSQKGQMITVRISNSDYQKLNDVRGDWTISYAIRQLIRTDALESLKTS